MRLFTGIAIASPVHERLIALLNDLRATADINWSPPGNLHITSKFIGSWPGAQVPELQSALAQVTVAGPGRAVISGFGFFPNPHHPHSFFAAVKASAGLAELAQKIDAALEPLGCKPETRPYTPHVTLARIKNQDIRELRCHLASIENADFGEFDVTEFHLYRSEPGAYGSVYTKLASYRLDWERS